MRFVHFSTSDGPGGAGRAAYRLHAALRDAGHRSQMLVRDQTSADRDVAAVPANPLVAQLRRLQKHLPFVRPPRARFTFNCDLEPGIGWRRVVEAVTQPPEAVCLHWVAEFLTAKSIRAIYSRFAAPLLWIMMDQEPVTGGCHYSFGCDGYQRECGNCPLLERPSSSDRSRQVFLRKRRFLADLPITFVAPTSWVERRIRASALFGGHRVERIGLPIDTGLFCPGDRAAARQRLGIPRDKQVVFFGSSFLHEARKGGDHLIEALRRLHDDLRCRSKQGAGSLNNVAAGNGRALEADDVLLLMAGHNGAELKHRLPFPVHDLGYLANEQTLATAYRAADAFICPSIEDAGPMMIPEAMLCGTPVVAFDTGGAPDLIVTGHTGYLARFRDTAELAHGIEQVLASPARSALGRDAAVAARRAHDPEAVAKRYAALVTELSGRTPEDKARPAAA